MKENKRAPIKIGVTLSSFHNFEEIKNKLRKRIVVKATGTPK